MRYFGLIALVGNMKCGRSVPIRQLPLQYNKAKLWQDELKFGVDLNGDSDTGLVTVEDNRECAS